MYMGLRVSEALALSMYDIDLKHKKMNINKTLTTDEIGGVIMGKKTKTYAGKRILPIPDFLYPYIVEQMKVANNQTNNEEKLLFKPLNQKYTKRENVNSELKRILEKYFNITDISTHSLRHTFAVHSLAKMVQDGMDIYCALPLLSVFLGHKTLKGTETYVRLTQDMFPDILLKQTTITRFVYPEINIITDSSI